MYYKMNDKEEELIKKVQKITMTNYDALGEFIEPEAMMSAIEDLYIKVDELEEELSDLNRDLEENYEPISISRQID